MKSHKKIVCYSFLILFFSYSCKEDEIQSKELTEETQETEETDIESTISSKVNLLFPTNNMECHPNENGLTFEWEASTELDVNYILRVYTDYPIDSYFEDFKTDVTSHTVSNLIIENSKAFSWEVLVEKNEQVLSTSDRFYFSTESISEVEPLPSYPTLVSPSNGSLLNSSQVILQWESDTSELKQDVIYSVYLGTSLDNLEKVFSGSETSFSTALQVGKTYYWRVDVSDNTGGRINQNIWVFSS